MPYHGLKHWSRSEMTKIANDLSRRPKFNDGEIVETKRDNGCLCKAEVVKSWISGGEFVYSLLVIGRDIHSFRITRKESEIF